MIPGAAAALEYRWSAVAAGEIWRPLTAQLTHWTARMALMDLGAVLLLGGWLEARAPRLARTTLAAAAVAVAVILPWITPPGGAYRGASGIATALLVALALHVARTPAGGLGRWFSWPALGLLAVKVGLEAATGRALAAGPLPPGVEVSPLTHLAGALTGAACGWRLGQRDGSC